MIPQNKGQRDIRKIIKVKAKANPHMKRRSLTQVDSILSPRNLTSREVADSVKSMGIRRLIASSTKSGLKRKRKTLKNLRKPSDTEMIIRLGNGDRVQVEQVGVVSLVLFSSQILKLKDIVYVPSMRRNLISVVALDHDGYFCNFGNGKLQLLYDSCVIGYGFLCDGLYKIDLDLKYTNSINAVTCKKRGRIDERSSMLWHKRLGHISRDKMQRLIKEGVLHDLDFLDFDTCVDCIKGKLPARARKGKKGRKQDVLEMIYTDICGPITPSAIGGYKYFITFIDDCSRFGWVELLAEKSESLSAFKTFKAAIELKLGKKIKCVHSDRGGEYYGRYDENDKNPSPFARYI